jgi:hypothetical protein
MSNKLKITINYPPGTRVTWLSDDCQKQLQGYVVEVNVCINSTGYADRQYTIVCDELIKGSRTHIVGSKDLSAI